PDGQFLRISSSPPHWPVSWLERLRNSRGRQLPPSRSSLTTGFRPQPAVWLLQLSNSFPHWRASRQDFAAMRHVRLRFLRVPAPADLRTAPPIAFWLWRGAPSLRHSSSSPLRRVPKPDCLFRRLEPPRSPRVPRLVPFQFAAPIGLRRPEA